jgi:pyrimidine operon attenuation protein/uracil phosphoribosyltransferase
VRLAVLIDRGHREVPVKPNYVGKNIPSSEKDRVRVRLRGLEQAERDQVVIYSLMTPLPGAVLSVHSDEQTEAS